MSHCLCIYYSRTGNTRAVMGKIAELLDAELLEITDGKGRKGPVGFVAAGLDAMKKTPEALAPFETKRPLGQYDEIVLATPVWAGRCSSVVRSFLKQHGKELNRVAYVLTRSSDRKSEDVYRQMDLYTAQPHRVATSLRVGHVGHTFWQEEFLRQLRELLESNG